MGLLAILAGCGAGQSTGTGTTKVSPVPLAHFSGRVMSGQQGVSASTVQIYAAGTAGYASAALPIMGSPAVTDAQGNFTVAGNNVCAGSSTLIYAVARGGNPDLAAGVNNASLVFATALGSCGSVTASTLVTLNEVTTAATAWALAPFMKSATQLGTSSTNAAGLGNAFMTARALADSSTGVSPSALLEANATAESGKVYAMANVLATCAHSEGGQACGNLFSLATPAGGTAPSDTLQAALSIVGHPGDNVRSIYALASAGSPFNQGLSAAPSDWTMSIAYRGGGMNEPTALAFDSNGNVWLANYPGTYSASMLSGFSSQGAPISTTGFSGSGLRESYGLTVDVSNNVWVTNEQSPASVNGSNGTVSEFSTSGMPMSGATGYAAGGLDFPIAAAADTNGSIWVANYASSTATLLSSSGVPLSGATGYGGGKLSLPVAVAVDAAHNAWLASQGSGSITQIGPDGSVLNQVACCNEPTAVTVDAHGNVWVANYSSSSVSEVSAAGKVLSMGYTGGGLDHPQGITVDGAGSVWVANYRGDTISELAGAGAAAPQGTPLSPAGGLGADARAHLPFAIAVDASGSIWISSFGDNRVISYVGLATPVRTPVNGPAQLP